MSFINVVARKTRLLHFTTIGLVIAALMAGILNPLFNSGQTAYAAQLTTRSVAISTSKTSATATYIISFTTPATTNIGSIIIQACTTPLSTCTAPTGMTMNAGTTGTWTGTSATNFTRTASTTGTCTVGANQWCGTRTAASETAGAKTLTLAGLTNPSTLGSFYLRITTLSDAAYATAVDNGVVASSTANQLTVSARIQEILTFCVGTTAVNDATTTPGVDCSAISGTAIDIGVLDSGSINLSPVNTNGGSNTNGIAMVRTNAQNGVTISYFAEQDTSSGAFKVAGQSCSGTVTTDQCINSQGATQGTFTAGTEKFGMTIAAVNCVSTTSYTCAFTSGTYKLVRDTDYDGTGGNTYGTTQGYAWLDNGTSTVIASSSTVVDDEALILRFAATPSITTPTGAYTVTSTYVATATF